MINLILGRSGSGKSTVVKYLQNQYHYKPLLSYTTRPKRYPEEEGHIFITKSEEVPLLKDIVAETYFDGYHYFATKEQLNNSDLYIIDPIGLWNLKDVNKRSFYIDVSESILKQRLYDRDRSLDRYYWDLKNYPTVSTEIDYRIQADGMSISEIGDYIHHIIKGR